MPPIPLNITGSLRFLPTEMEITLQLDTVGVTEIGSGTGVGDDGIRANFGGGPLIKRFPKEVSQGQI